MFFATIDSLLDMNCHCCEKTVPIRLALVGLMTGWQADEIWGSPNLSIS